MFPIFCPGYTLHIALHCTALHSVSSLDVSTFTAFRNVFGVDLYC